MSVLAESDRLMLQVGRLQPPMILSSTMSNQHTKWIMLFSDNKTELTVLWRDPIGFLWGIAVIGILGPGDLDLAIVWDYSMHGFGTGSIQFNLELTMGPIEHDSPRSKMCQATGIPVLLRLGLVSSIKCGPVPWCPLFVCSCDVTLDVTLQHYICGT